ncbi:unnamed protein product, partial [Musa banksii]
ESRLLNCPSAVRRQQTTCHRKSWEDFFQVQERLCCDLMNRFKQDPVFTIIPA